MKKSGLRPQVYDKIGGKMRQDILADALSMVKNAENVGKDICEVPRSKTVLAVLRVLKESNYIADFTEKDKNVEVTLSGKINALSAIKPRFPVKKDGYVKFESRYLPSRDIGLIIVSTSKGVVSHKQAKETSTGGRLIAYVY